MNHPHLAPHNRAPWWAYAIPFAVLNGLRQIVFPPSETGDVMSIALFVAIAAFVALTVTTACRLLRA